MEQGRNRLFLWNADWVNQSEKHHKTQIANAFPSKAIPQARYRRIQRFVHDYPINFDTVAWFMILLFNFVAAPFYLTLDDLKVFIWQLLLSKISYKTIV